MVPPSRFCQRWGWSHNLRRTIEGLLDGKSGHKIVHLHGVWMASQWVGARAAGRRRLPFVLTTYGMLHPWLWNYKGLLQLAKKRLYWHLMASPSLREAAVVHAITQRERDVLSRYLPRCRIEVIPLAVDLAEIDEARNAVTPAAGPTAERLLLFIGRLDPQKGIDVLINAFNTAGLASDWRLVIAGPERVRGYRQMLEAQVERSGLGDRVVFVGSVTGAQKWHLYGRAWVTLVPSRFEEIAAVNLEAAASETPTITTFATGLTDWTEGGGLLVRGSVSDLSQALATAARWSERERLDRGRASRRLIERKYSWSVVGPQWQELYGSLLA